MADQLNSENVRPPSVGVGKRGSTDGVEAPNAAESRGTASDLKAAKTNTVAARHNRQYLIAVRPVPGASPASADSVHEALSQMEGVEILRRQRPKGFKGLGAGALPVVQEIISVRMDDQRADMLRQTAPLQIMVEADAPLSAGQTMIVEAATAAWPVRTIVLPRVARELRIRVVGSGDQPLAGAGVTLIGRASVAQTVTDSAGLARLTLFDNDPDFEEVQALHIQPAADYWDCHVRNPVIDPEGATLARMIPLQPPSANTNGQRRASWGRRAMNLDQGGAGLNGAGVKIALIDSGCDTSHSSLRHITAGTDLTRERDWKKDTVGQGTHCAGIIAGNGNGDGVRGCAPEAGLEIFKVSPSGHCSDLIEAIDDCIERQFDLVMIGASCDHMSELLAYKIIEARARGVACVVPAGDTGGRPQFLATIPGVLAVAAIGKLGEFARDTRHATTVVPELTAPTGLFVANFSAFGAQIGLCGPGVAIISSAPGGGLSARDGTAAAAAYITGFAALLLAHHPLFQQHYAGRNEQRVNALFQLLQASATAPVFDPTRVGAGLPDLLQVPGLGAMPDIDSWNKAMRSFATMSGAPETMRFGPVPPAHMAENAALMQLRAAGLI